MNAAREILLHDANVFDGVERTVGRAGENAWFAELKIIAGARLQYLDGANRLAEGLERLRKFKRLSGHEESFLAFAARGGLG